MDLDVIFLGTGGSVPSARRNTASVMVQRGGDRLMFDCGEGTQRQLQRSVGLVQVSDLFITHLHADHYLGLPGLIKSYEMQDRDEPLIIYGPPGLRELFAAVGRIIGRVNYPIDLEELEPGDPVTFDGYTVEAFEVSHRIRANGYLLWEEERPGRFDPERARELGVSDGPDFGRLQRGESVAGSAGTVGPEQVMSAARPSRKVALTGDTEPCDGVRTAAQKVDLLVHDASFASSEIERAAETRHSTARQAATIAAEAEAKMLALVHISGRHFVPDVLAEAREVFEPTIAPRDFDLISIPFPERGEPTHVEGGAKPGRREVAERAVGGEIEADQVSDSISP
ncbi:MAG: ribonuclease Z [Solirubrobacterales bacterium]